MVAEVLFNGLLNAIGTKIKAIYLVHHLELLLIKVDQVIATDECLDFQPK